MIESSTYGGVAASDGALGECLRTGAPGESSQAVWRRCSADRSTFIALPNGGTSSEVDVIGEILVTGGVPAGTASRIQEYTGTFTISGSGNVFTTSRSAPTQTGVRYFAEQKEEIVPEVTALVESAVGGAEPSAEALIGISVPGVPLPQAAIESIASEPDPAMRAYKADALASNLALAKSKWDLVEDLSTLDAAVRAAEMTPDQEEIAREALANVEREVRRLEELKSIIDQHYSPMVGSLLETRAHQLAEASIATANTQPSVSTAARYDNGQTSFGYRQ